MIFEDEKPLKIQLELTHTCGSTSVELTGPHTAASILLLINSLS